MGSNRVLNVAHRGASALAPENTLAAFELALELGADGIELDTMLSADGELVVIHDHTVDRTTDGSGPVRHKSLTELQSLDAGSKFSPRFRGERIPMLRQVFDLVGRRGLIDVEISTRSPRGDGLEEKLVGLIRASGLQETVVVTSFNPFALWRMRRLAPEIRLGIIFAEDLPMVLRDRWLAFLSRPDLLVPRRTMVTAEFVSRAVKDGQQVWVWTDHDDTEMARLVDMGAHAIITDRPDELSRVLGR
jgi:glycerophosphoryl diester phosphodiesterase